MRITELLSKESIALGVKVDSKDAAIDYLVNLHDAAGNISDKKTYKEGILKREEEGSTAIGEGIAIPHSKNKAVKRPGLAAMTVPDGVDYDSLDGQPSNLFFMIADQRADQMYILRYFQDCLCSSWMRTSEQSF